MLRHWDAGTITLCHERKALALAEAFGVHYMDGGSTFVKGNMMQMMRRLQAGECQHD